MRVLLIKTSSMGDILHTLPALTDAQQALPTVSFDWLIEEAFAEIPLWHKAVNEVIPISLRRWRKGIFAKSTKTEWRHLRLLLKERKYDVILDAQGLIKSALFTFLTKGKRAGLDWRSARESLASLAYQHKCSVNYHQHAVVRMRSLFSQALAFPTILGPANFGLDKTSFFQEQSNSVPYLVFLHATTWATKQWPEVYWIELANLAVKAGLQVKMSGGNDAELARSKRIAGASPAIHVLPRQTISDMAVLLANAYGVVALDTGFGHLAGALGVPTLALYGPTNPELTGVLGERAQNELTDFHCSPCLRRHCRYKVSEIMPPCFTKLAPSLVWQKLVKLINN